MIIDLSDDDAVGDDNGGDEDQFVKEAYSISPGDSEKSGSEKEWETDGDVDGDIVTNNHCMCVLPI